jgi:ATP-dependent Clp protease protease subunit
MKKLLTLLIALVVSFQTYAQVSLKTTKEIVLVEDNTVSLRDAFTDESVAGLIEKVSKLNSNLPSGYPINLVLYSPGGSIQAGLELFGYLKGINRPVNTITLFAASMGFQAVQQLGTRYIMEFGVLMSHKARGGFEGEFDDGDESQMDSRAGLWKRRIAIMNKHIINRTNGKQTAESYKVLVAPELWMNGQEAVDKGFADEVVSVKCSAELEKGTENIVMNTMFGSVRLTLSACPIRTAILDATMELSTNQGKMTLENFAQKGGKLGSECRSAGETKTTYNYEQRSESPIFLAPELCVIDNSITLEQIKKAIQEKVTVFKKDIKNRVIYSY